MNSLRPAALWVSALRERLSAESGQPVTLLEIHISWVLLTTDSAYKLKKPVKLTFLDFSTIRLRKHFCEEEVRLNRRFATDLYLGVVPICGTRAAPMIGGHGRPFEYAVHMKRFAPGALLAEMLAAGELQGCHIDRLAHRIASVHETAPVAAGTTHFGTADQVEQDVAGLIDQLHALRDDPRIEYARKWFESNACRLRSARTERRDRGAVRECHGDLHLANVMVLEKAVIPFDCIEFDPTLRWIDVLNDFAFLTMDLKARGRSDLAWRLIDRYLQHSGDYAGLQVLRPYEIARALVRALIGLITPRSVRGPTSDAVADGVDYLQCASQLIEQTPSSARLMITHGLSGSGKSHMAGLILEEAGAIRIRSDVERKRLFGLDELQRSAPRGIDIYSVEAGERTISRLLECASAALCAGYPVIVDAAFLRRADRNLFQQLAATSSVPFCILSCRAGDTVLRQRVILRNEQGLDASEANLAVLEEQQRRLEPLDAGELEVVIEVATDAHSDAAALAARWPVPIPRAANAGP